jgi:hypothetical protein
MTQPRALSLERGLARARVELAQEAQLLHVQPMVQELNVLQTVRHGFSARSTRYEIERRLDPLYRLEPSDRPERAVFAAGFRPVVAQLLTDAGYEIRHYVEAGPRLLPRADLSRIAFATIDEDKLYNQLVRLQRALFVVERTRFDFAALVVKAALALPDARIAVIDANISRNYALYHQLRRCLPDVGFATSRNGLGEPEHRVIVSTYGGMAFQQHEHRDMIFVVDAVTAVGQRGDYVLERAERARLFGLIDLHEQLSPYERDRLIGKFGLVRLRAAAPGNQIVPVRFCQPRFHGRATLSAVRRIEFERAALWRHPPRNRRIAGYARALCQRDESTNVAVLVDNVEHAVYLARHLPGWPVVTGHAVRRQGLKRWQQDILSRSQIDDTTRHLIATRAGLDMIDIYRAHVVIRADGGRGLPFGDEVPVGRGGDVLVLVDVDDRHHPQLRIRSRQRYDAYLDAGWVPIIADSMRALINQFLRRRPRGALCH